MSQEQGKDVIGVDVIGIAISLFLVGMIIGMLIAVPLNNMKIRRIAVQEKRGVWAIDSQTGKKTFVYYKPSTELP